MSAALASHIGANWSPGCSTSDSAPCLGIGKAVDNGVSLWALVLPLESLKRFCVVSSLADMAIWGVKQQMEDVSL